MFVAMVTAPKRPACAMMCASCSWNLALRTLWLSPRLASRRARCSEFSIEIVPTRHGCPVGVALDDLLDHRAELGVDRAVDEVVAVVADHLAVRRDDEHRQLVDLAELGVLGDGRTGHAGELLVHAEVVLQGDGGQRLVLLADVHALLGLDGLVQALGVAAADHQAAGELVDDEHLAVLDDVVDVALEQELGLQRLLEVVDELAGRVAVDVLDAGQLLDLASGRPR